MANSSRGRGDGASILWVVVAVLVIGGFLAWLTVTAEPSVPPSAMEQEEEPEEAVGGPAELVSAADFAGSAAGYNGRVVELSNVPVVQRMGAQIFWIELPGAQGATPYLVKLSDALVAAGVALPAEQTRVTVEGMVMQKSDSVLNAWEQAGVLESGGHRAQAEFGDTYIEARAVRPAS